MAVEHAIRSLQERLRAVDAGSREVERHSLLNELAKRVRQRVAEATDLDPSAPEARETARRLVQRVLTEEESVRPLLVLSPGERGEIEERVLATMFGFGILTPLLDDPSITEIMVNGLDQIFVEREGAIQRIRNREGRPIAFTDKGEALAVIEKIVSPLNRKVDESDPIVDARLPDGSRVCVVLPPVALDGPTITIRKFPRQPFSLDDLVCMGALNPRVRALLERFVCARVNIVVSGATASGKTTFLNALGMVIPTHERIVTVEDAAELRLTQVENLARMEARPANIEGRGRISIRDLVRTALRMRPDRIIVGEVRGGEALDMLQAMNTGHDGSLTTAHANSAHDLISRLETMVLMSGMELPIQAVRQQITSSVELIVHLSRLPGGRRQVTQIVEVLGLQDGQVSLADLFRWDAEVNDLVWSGRQITRTEKYHRFGLAVPDLEEVSFG